MNNETIKNELKSFSVTKIDLGDISVEELTAEHKPKARTLLVPGTYTLRVLTKTLSEGRLDGAGKRWGSLRLGLEEVESGRTTTTFIDVPCETLAYTSKNGSVSKVKAQIFYSFLKSIGADTKNIEAAISTLGESIAIGSTLRMSMGFTKDRVSFIKEDDHGAPLYGIKRVDDSVLTDSLGSEILFADRQGATAYYKSQNGYNPSAGGLNVKSYLAPIKSNASKVA